MADGKVILNHHILLYLDSVNHWFQISFYNPLHYLWPSSVCGSEKEKAEGCTAGNCLWSRRLRKAHKKMPESSPIYILHLHWCQCFYYPLVLLPNSSWTSSKSSYYIYIWKPCMVAGCCQHFHSLQFVFLTCLGFIFDLVYRMLVQTRLHPLSVSASNILKSHFVLSLMQHREVLSCLCTKLFHRVGRAGCWKTPIFHWKYYRILVDYYFRFLCQCLSAWSLWWKFMQVEAEAFLWKSRRCFSSLNCSGSSAWMIKWEAFYVCLCDHEIFLLSDFD